VATESLGSARKAANVEGRQGKSTVDCHPLYGSRSEHVDDELSSLFSVRIDIPKTFAGVSTHENGDKPDCVIVVLSSEIVASTCDPSSFKIHPTASRI